MTTGTKAVVAPLAIRLFGPLSVLVEGEPIAHLRSRKAQWLLALLVLRHGRPVEREWLAGTLWPDVEQTLASANLRPILSELRKALGSQSERLQSPNRHSLLLEMTGAEVDVVAFDAAIASKTVPTLKRAVALYQGPLLEGCTEEWVTQERAGREQACLAALKTLAESALAAGDSKEAVDFYRRATSLDPIWDTAWRGLMESLDKGGDRNAALQVYREFVSTLSTNDPRAVPGEETTALYRRLRDEARRQASAPPPREEMTPAPGVAGYLPNSFTELVGREDERLEVADRLRLSRLVTLTGPGGIGKTRLADAVAQEVVREYPDGVWLVPLESLPPGSGSVEEQQRPVLQQIASMLGIKEGSGRPLLTIVTDHLRRKRLLLVLDNCEHLLEPCAGVIASLLQGCPGLRFLATSREPLRVSGETAWSVPALPVPDVEQMPSGRMTLVRMLTGYDGVRLFVERAEAVRKTFALTGDNARDVARLCSRLAGIPLALELAAARTAVLAPAEILAQFDARPLDALASRLRDTVPRHRTLRATLEWSYGLLPPEARTFLLSMGVFRGGWTLEAAQAVCPEADAPEMLTVLKDASLINVTETEDGSRFSLLETVRQFALEELEKSGHMGVVRERHARHYVGWIGKKAEGLVRRRNFASVEREYPNITAVLSTLLDVGDDNALADLCSTFSVFWDGSGRNRERLDWLEIVIRRVLRKNSDESKVREVTKDGPDLTGETHFAPLSADQARLMQIQVDSLYAIGDWEACASACLRSYDLYLRAGIPLEKRTSLFNASVLRSYSDLGSALTLMEQCLPLERAASADGRGNPVILARLALVNRLAGFTEKAAAFLAEALELGIGQEESDPYGYTYAVWAAGSAALAEGDLIKAQDQFDTALSVARRVPIANLATEALCSLAALAHEQGDHEQEQIYLSEAEAVAGSDPIHRVALALRQRRAELFLVRRDHSGVRATVFASLAVFQGKAAAFRMYLYPCLLVLAERELLVGLEPYHAGRAARLLGASIVVAERLGLVSRDRAERERIVRLRRTLSECPEPEPLAYEEAAGAALDDEAALELALAIER